MIAVIRGRKKDPPPSHATREEVGVAPTEVVGGASRSHQVDSHELKSREYQTVLEFIQSMRNYSSCS